MHYFKARVHLEQAGQREVVPLWEYDIEAPTSQGQLAYTSLPAIAPVFSSLLVTGPLTDVLEDGAIGGAGFLVSQKLRTLLANFNLGPHRFYPLQTFHYATGKPLSTAYFWLQIIALDCYEGIDYANSTFVLVDDLEEHLLAELALNSPAELQAAVELAENEDHSIRYTGLTFNKLGNTNPPDIFYLNSLSDSAFTYPLFSEQLKTALETQAITGFEFKLAPLTWPRS